MRARSRIDRNLLSANPMKHARRQRLIGLIAAVMFVLPLVWLQSQLRDVGGSGNMTVMNSTSSYGWPFLCWHSRRSMNPLTSAQISLTSNCDTWALMANIFVLLFVGSSFGLFFAGIEQIQFSVLELLAIVFLVAIALAPWSSEVLWNTTDATKPRPISQSPPWAEYLVYFAIGAAVATVLRWVSQRFSARSA